MKHTGLAPFVHIFPRQGAAETRVLYINGDPFLPDDEYGLMESYCVQVGCHCRRVMINLAARRQGKILAAVSYAFDRDDEFPGPALDPLNPQSRYAEVLLDLTAQVLDDPVYVDRLEAHYYQVKGAVNDPGHPCHLKLAATDHLLAPRRSRPPRDQTQRTRRSR